MARVDTVSNVTVDTDYSLTTLFIYLHGTLTLSNLTITQRLVLLTNNDVYLVMNISWSYSIGH